MGVVPFAYSDVLVPNSVRIRTLFLLQKDFEKLVLFFSFVSKVILITLLYKLITTAIV